MRLRLMAASVKTCTAIGWHEYRGVEERTVQEMMLNVRMTHHDNTRQAHIFIYLDNYQLSLEYDFL